MSRPSLALVALVAGALGCRGAAPPTPTESCAPDAPMPEPQCVACASLSAGDADRALVSRFAAEFAPVVTASSPGGAPVVTPGALTNTPAGTLLRYAIASTDPPTPEGAQDPDLAAARALFDAVESSLGSSLAAAASTPPLSAAPSEDDARERDELTRAIGTACSGLLALRTLAADPLLATRARAWDAPIFTALDRALQDVPEFVVAQAFAPDRLANAGRMLVVCGALSGQTAASAAGLGPLDAALDRMSDTEATDGALLDESGRFDLNRQAFAVQAALEALRAIPTSSCAARIARVRRAARWLATRVTPQGQVDTTGSAQTCQTPSSGTLRLTLDRGAVFRALAEGASWLEPAPPSPLPPLTENDPWAPLPLTRAALRVSAHAFATPGTPTCFP